MDINNFLSKLFGNKSTRDMKEIQPIVETIKAAYPEIEKLTNDELRAKTQEIKKHVQESALDRSHRYRFRPRVGGYKDFVHIDGDKAIYQNHWMAGGNEITWDMVHYDVQLFGGVVLHQGKIAEMATGEGKTLVATLPVFLNALTGNGVHVVTVNDYLSKRDCEWMGPIYEFNGLSVDCIDLYQPNSDERRKAYLADITFGTNNEFGFDYLRDNMATSPSDLVQRAAQLRHCR
jgi:preprotein translocase subunit SecA